jgi:hypothetical protein
MTAAVTVKVAWSEEAGQWWVTITPPGRAPVSHPMAADHDDTGFDWPMPHPSTRPDRDAVSWDRTGDEFRELAGAVAERTATAVQAEAYGRHLFDALLGPDGTAALDGSPGPPLVVELCWKPGPLHRFVWELMNDGQGYLALRESAPVVFVRLVGPRDATGPVTITRPPRILFAVGSALDDKEVRAGAEIMGLLRDFEREAGIQGTAVRTRVVTNASLARLRREYQQLDPDIVHLIGHGRWDSQAKLGKLTLAPDPSGAQRTPPAEGSQSGEECTAATLAEALSKLSPPSTPVIVVVSACEGGVATTGAGLPLAAELAASVPIVIAMAGAISDTACRVFTRSVVCSVARGKEFTEALATGRRAAFAPSTPTPENVDWALPAVFLRASLPTAFKLADPQAVEGVRTVIRQHGHIRLPLFAGRYELLDDLDALLRPGNPNVLVLYSSYEHKIGGTRALQELAAEAIRKGHLPVRIGEYTSGDAPRTFPALAEAIAKRVLDLAKLEGVRRPRRTLLLLTGHDPDGSADVPSADDLLDLPLRDPPPSAHRLVDELRADVFALRDAVVAVRPEVLQSEAVPVLLLDDVHLYTDGIDDLLAQLTTTGLGVAQESLPVILFAKEHVLAGAEVARYRGKNRGQGPIKFRELLHVTMLPGGADGLAYLTWLLNPPRDVPGWPDEVLAPKEGIEPKTWQGIFKMAMRERAFYDPEGHQDFAAYVLEEKWVETGQDDTILQAYGMLS